MCSYHGWRFNGEGHAVSIPQAHFQNPAAEQAACNSSRSYVKSYPTQVCPSLLLYSLSYAAWLDYFIGLGLMSYCKCLSLITVVQVQEGLLFVWPSSGPEAFIHSAAVSPAGSQVAEQVTSGKLSC